MWAAMEIAARCEVISHRRKVPAAAFCLATMVGAVRPIGWLSCNAFQLVDAVRDVLGPVKQLVMSRVRRIAKLGVLAGRTLSADRLEINRRKDGVLGLDAPGGSFLEQRYRGLTAARAMKDVNIQARHDSSPVVEESICLARKEACGGNRHSARLEIAPRADEGSLSAVSCRSARLLEADFHRRSCRVCCMSAQDRGRRWP